MRNRSIVGLLILAAGLNLFAQNPTQVTTDGLST